MPRLRELEARFIRREVRIEKKKFLRPGIDPLRGNWTDADFEEREGETVYFVFVDSLAEADGVEFLCPACFAKNNGPVGTHGVICWFVGKVPDDAEPKPGRWTPSGTGLDDLTFVPGNPPKAISVLLTGNGCGWHGFVKDGSAA